MAYSTSNQPRLIASSVGSGPRMWLYSSTDAAATADGSGYFTDGYTLGMRDGDLAFVYDTGTKIWTMHTVTASSTTIDLANGAIVGTSTNSD